MIEQWKDIQGYEGLYQISNLGNVKSLNYNRTNKEKVLKPIETKTHYLRIGLTKNGKTKLYSVHRLVALMFIENPLNKPYINHLDCDVQNNRVDNLEWCTPKENTQYASKLGRLKGGKKRTSIIATNLQTGEELYFESQREAERQLNILHSNINSVLKGRYKQTGGYIFKYVEDPN